ncbi:hypothetical protein B296_00056072, partial [Ensete ventricosum]
SQSSSPPPYPQLVSSPFSYKTLPSTTAALPSLNPQHNTGDDRFLLYCACGRPINGSNLCSGGCVMLQPQLLDEEDAQGDLHERHEQLQRAQSQQQRVVPGPPGVHRRLLRQGSALSEGATQGEDREQGWSVLLHLQRSGGDLPDRRNHERPGAGRRCGRVRASAGGGVGGGIRVVGK